MALVVPAGLTADPAITQTSARAMVTTVSRYWSGQTGANVSFNTAQVMPAYRSAYGCTGTFANTFQMWEEALARMPEAFGPGKHLVLIAPGAAYAHHCFYGLGTVGAIEYEGNEVFVSGLNQSLLAHELGHNLGLYHSNSLRCSGAQDMAMVGIAFPGCQANAYDDLFDVMGYSGSTYGEGSLNAVHLDGMNLLPNAVRKIEADSGVTTARITPLSTSTDNRTLKITDPSGADYFVEYRTNSGLDAVASRNPWRPAWGVRVLRDDPEAPPSGGSYELDATPTSLSSYDYNRSIPLGATLYLSLQETDHQGRRAGCLRGHPDHRKLGCPHRPLRVDPFPADDGVGGHRDHCDNQGERPARQGGRQLACDPAEDDARHDDLAVHPVPAHDLDRHSVLPVRQWRLRHLPMGGLACDRRTGQDQPIGNSHLDRPGGRKPPRHGDDIRQLCVGVRNHLPGSGPRGVLPVPGGQWPLAHRLSGSSQGRSGQRQDRDEGAG